MHHGDTYMAGIGSPDAPARCKKFSLHVGMFSQTTVGIANRSYSWLLFGKAMERSIQRQSGRCVSRTWLIYLIRTRAPFRVHSADLRFRSVKSRHARHFRSNSSRVHMERGMTLTNPRIVLFHARTSGMFRFTFYADAGRTSRSLVLTLRVSTVSSNHRCFALPLAHHAARSLSFRRKAE